MISIQGLVKVYRKGSEVLALDNVSFRVPRGEFLAIAGPSGSGKTTLLNLIGTLDYPTSGAILFDGTDLRTLKEKEIADFRRQNIGFVFQLFNLLPALTALENVMLPLLPYRKSLPFTLEERARKLLAEVGLSNRMNHLPSELSGGEQQRVAIARALVNYPKVVLADEPTGNVDSKVGEEIVALLRQLNNELNLTIVLVTHDIAVATQAHRLLHLQDGRLVR